MLAELDASGVRRWCHACADALAACRQEIDDLNVYPVPDGDTGTNMALTLRQAAEVVAADISPTAGGVVRAMARGAVLGARGNSGVILSQVLRGMADSLGDAEEMDGLAFCAALEVAADAAWAAVMNPVEGTILSVARGAAEGAAQAGQRNLSVAVSAAAAAAHEALRRTPEQLEVLARAGVVDAGGRGLVVVLDALAHVVTGAPMPTSPVRLGPRSRAALESARETGSSEFAFEVQYLLRAEEAQIPALRSHLNDLGDSVAVVGTGDGLFNVHVHVNDVGAAIEAGVEAGRPHRITVVRFEDQIAAQTSVADRAGTAIVAIAPGDGLADLFRSEGVHVVEGGPTNNPSTEEVLREILATNAAQVVLLPNSAAVSGVAQMAAEEARERGMHVSVVATKSPVQALAAIAVHDQQRRFDTDVIAMAEASAHTRFAEVTIAVRESITIVGRCVEGDVLGLIDGEVVEIGDDVTQMGCLLIGRLVRAGGELVTVLWGEGEDTRYCADAIAAWVGAEYPFVEVIVMHGGQPHYPLLIGVE